MFELLSMAAGIYLVFNFLSSFEGGKFKRLSLNRELVEVVAIWYLTCFYAATGQWVWSCLGATALVLCAMSFGYWFRDDEGAPSTPDS